MTIRATILLLALASSSAVACGSDDDDSEGTGGAGTTGGASTSGGSNPSGGATSGGSSSIGGGSSSGGGTGLGLLGAPCTTAADCDQSDYFGPPECLTSFPNGYCSSECSGDPDCGTAVPGYCEDRDGDGRYECFISCFNLADPANPFDCPAGYVCEDIHICVPQ